MSRTLSNHWLTKVGPSIALAVAICATWASAADRLPTGTFVSGNLGVIFSTDRTYQVTQDGELVVEGTYSVNHGQVVF
jgi:hypothetical protein